MATKYPAQGAIPTCEDHEGEELDTFCRTCDRQTCEICIKTTHKDHDWTSKAKIVKERRNKRQEIVDDITKNILPAIARDRKPKKEKGNTQQEVSKIRSVQRRLIDHINKYSDSLVVAVEGDGEGTKDWTKDIELLMKIRDFFEEKILDAHENVVLEVDEDYRRIKTVVATKTSDLRSRFVEGPFLPETLEYMIGEVVNTADNTDTAFGPHVSVCDSRQFTCGTEFIKSISTNEDGTVWIHQTKSSKNLLVDSSGQVKSELDTKVEFDDCIVLDNGDHVFTCFGSKDIRKVTPTGHVTVVCSTAPLRPAGISMSRDGHMLVGLCDGYVDEITTDSRGVVHLMDMSGKVMKRYGADGRTKLFTNPTRIVQNVNLDLVVVDIIDKEFRTKIIGVSVDGRSRFTYKGQASLEESFCGKDVCCDQHGHIILADYLNHAVHMLSADGQFVQYLLTEQDGLWGPRSLALRDNTLWVGCVKGVVRVVKLKSN